MDAMADEIGNGATRIQLKRKSPRAWAEFMSHLREHSQLGMANTMARYQALRPSLYDFEDRFRALDVPVLLALGDEDGPCLETNLMLKRAIPGAGSVDPPAHRPRHQPRGAGGLQLHGRVVPRRRRAARIMTGIDAIMFSPMRR